MTSDLCTDDVVVQITSPQTITPEGGTAAVGGGGGGGGAGARGAVGGGAELGRRLLFAARAGDTQAVLDLMAKGAPFTTDWLGTSPLHLAAANAHAETCAVLLRAGVSRDARTKVERTPLHLAAHAGHARVVRLLLEHGANVDCRDMLCMTPLHWAAARGHLAAARELLSRGADPRARCKFRKTPRCLALRASAARIVRLLDDALAQRELAASLRPIANDADEETDEKELEHITRVQEINSAKVNQQQDKNIKIEAKTEVRCGGADAGAEAEALLRRHGITLLPTDDGSTVLSALQSGRTVVLSDAGKLMLKESGSANSSLGSTLKNVINTGVNSTAAPTVVSKSSIIGGAGGAGGGGISASAAGSGVVLTAKAVKSPPRAGLKVFTLNSLSALGGVPTTPLRKIINPQDLQQVKIVQLPSEAKIMPSKVVSLAKNKKKLLQRPPVKILMNKSNFEKLIATASKTNAGKNAAEASAPTTTTTIFSADLSETSSASGAGAGAGAGACSEGNPACSCSGRLAAAQRALQRLAAELRAARARLAEYEPQ